MFVKIENPTKRISIYELGAMEWMEGGMLDMKWYNSISNEI